MTYAVVEIGGKQYRVESGQSLTVDRLPEKEGAKLTLKPLLYRPDKGEPVFDRAGLAKVKVEGKVSEHLRGEKIRVFKFKPKRGYKRTAGHRSELTAIEVTGIKTASASSKATTEKAKPSAEKTSKPSAEKQATVKPKQAAKAATAKKPAAKAAAKQAKKAGADSKPAKKATAKKEEG